MLTFVNKNHRLWQKGFQQIDGWWTGKT